MNVPSLIEKLTGELTADRRLDLMIDDLWNDIVELQEDIDQFSLYNGLDALSHTELRNLADTIYSTFLEIKKMRESNTQDLEKTRTNNNISISTISERIKETLEQTRFILILTYLHKVRHKANNILGGDSKY